MLIELTNAQVNAIWDTFKIHPSEFIAKMIPFRQIHPDTVISVCDAYYKFPIKSKFKTPVVADARRIGMTLISELSGLGHHSVGEIFGQNQSNVSHAKRYVYSKLGEDEKITNDYTKLKFILNETVQTEAV